MGKYLEIFHLGVGEFRGLLRTNLEMPLPTPLKKICGRYPKLSTGREEQQVQNKGHRLQVIGLPIQQVSETLVKANLRPKQECLG